MNDLTSNEQGYVPWDADDVRRFPLEAARIMHEQRTQLMELRAELAKRPPAETKAVQPIAWRRWIDSDYETKPRWIYTDQAPTVSPEKWEPLYASTAEKASEGWAEDPEHNRLKALRGGNK